MQIVRFYCETFTIEARQSFIQRDKGKAKLYEDYSFSDNGALSQRAISMIDEGKISAFADIFNKPVVDLEAPVMKGVRAGDVLHLAVLGRLDEFLRSTRSLELSNFSVLLPVSDVLNALGLITSTSPGTSSAKGSNPSV